MTRTGRRSRLTRRPRARTRTGTTIEVTTALLCDHAEVRDGLLFVLSGGITRIMRDSFPAAMGTCLALMLEFESTETDVVHQLEILVLGEDGEEVARMDAELQVDSSTQARLAENLQLPIAVDLRAAGLAKPGAYELHVAVDAQHRRTLQFWAEQIAGEGPILL